MTAFAKLTWQCRRGTKELDLLLRGYLEHGYPQADETEKKRFSELLQLEDSELSELLLKPADLQNQPDSLVKKIRAG